MKSRIKSLPRRGTQLAALRVIQETPQLIYQIFGFLRLKQDPLVAATSALHTALKNADESIIREINLEAESREAAVIRHGDIVVEMVIKKDGQTSVVIKGEDPRDSIRMLLGRGILDSLEN
jgi:hypothetical protein